MIQKYNLKGLAFKRGPKDTTTLPKIKDTVKADLQKQIPEQYALKTKSVNQKRLDKATPAIEKVSKNYPDGFTKPEIISELKKIFPKANDIELEQVYQGRKFVDGKLVNTFPFKTLMKEGALDPGAGAAKAQKDKAASRIQQYDDF